MGKILILSKFVFFVFSSDINEKRKHLHIRDKKGKVNRLCKFWIDPEISISYNYGFSKVELNEIRKQIEINLEIINIQLKKFYAGKQVKSITIK